jgi:hypothetical protein
MANEVALTKKFEVNYYLQQRAERACPPVFIVEEDTVKEIRSSYRSPS